VIYNNNLLTKEATKNTSVTSANNIKPESIINVVEEAKDKAANWEICKNEKYGYEAKYPAEWKIWKRGGGEARIATCDEESASFVFSSNIYTDDFYINIDVSNQKRLDGTIYKDSHSLDDYFNKNPLILKYRPTIRDILVDGEKAVLLKDNSLLLFNNDSLFELRIHGAEIDDVIVDKFITNFKFIK
jgi:hypothetical protein